MIDGENHGVSVARKAGWHCSLMFHTSLSNCASGIQVYAVVHLWPESQVLIGVTSLWTPKKQHVETSSGSFPKSTCGLAQGISLHYFLDFGYYDMIRYVWYVFMFALLISRWNTWWAHCWVLRTSRSHVLWNVVFRWCSFPTSIQWLKHQKKKNMSSTLW